MLESCESPSRQVGWRLQTKVHEIGEFGLIERLARIVPRQAEITADGAGIRVAIGDDAAVWMPSGGAQQVITTDALIEGVHFDLKTSSWHDLGWKSIAVNLSDVGAMGAQPTLGLITLGLPQDVDVADLEALYAGVDECARHWQVTIAGGDTVAAPTIMISVTVIGETTGPILRRSAGRAEDVLAVTGWLGLSGGGLRVLESHGEPSDPSDPLMTAHLRPWPRVAEGLLLAQAGVLCALDVSDGLRGDTAHICEQSALGATIDVDHVPVHAALLERFGRDEALRLALDGGEDYELLCAGPAQVIARAAASLDQETGTALTPIGKLHDRLPGEPLVRLVDGQGRPVELPGGSWDHFRV